MRDRSGDRDAGGRSGRPPARASLADRFCDAVDHINSWVGRFWALAIFVVTLAVLYEVVSRGCVRPGDAVGNETTIYLSAVAYLIGGGYALLHRRHVRIDLVYERCRRRTRATLDLFTFVFFLLYVGALIWVGDHDGVDLVPAGRGHRHAVEPADLAGQVRDPDRGRCCCSCKASPTCCVTSAWRAARAARHEHRAAEPAVRRGVRRASCSPGCRSPSPPARWRWCSPYALFGWPGLTLVVSRVFTLMGNYVLVSVPLFIFMACVLERAGIAEAIFRAAHVWAGRMRGGLAVAVIISCALMATMVGVIGAEIVTMGVVALPAMLARGYKKELALGCICAGGGLATLIPPSVVLIMYGLTAGVSIGQLYVAGIVPGLMLAAMYIAYIVVRCRQRPDFAPPASAAELRDIAAREGRPAARAHRCRRWSPSACSARSISAGRRPPKPRASACSARSSRCGGTAD